MTTESDRRVDSEQHLDRPVVLHVTEALGAGVGLSLARLVRLQTEAGARCVVLATRRYDTPDDAELRRWFGDEAELHVHPVTAGSSRSQLAWLAKEMARRILREQYTAIHLHSSFAGVVGRPIAAVLGRSSRTFYSPHGFGFLRSDLSRGRRLLVRWAERALASLGGQLILVSQSELDVAARYVGRRVSLLPNGVDIEACVPRETFDPGHRARVAMVGRVTYQKAPWRFADAARRLSGEADFVWLGYGEPADVENWLADAPVVLSGPLTHDELLRRLREMDVLYFPTLWEGMPLSVIEAQASGVPVVASDVDGNRDIVLDGETGFLRQEEGDMFEALEQLVQHPELRARFAARSATAARRFSDDRRGIESLDLYRRRRSG